MLSGAVYRFPLNRISFHCGRRLCTQFGEAPQYLHISPDGDWWIAPGIFAAKHLQDDYVRSFLLPESFQLEKLRSLHATDFQTIYDTKTLPEDMK